jgi:cytochrome c
MMMRGWTLARRYGCGLRGVLAAAGISIACGATETELADVAAGRKHFAACAACHLNGEPGAGPTGPDLRGVMGRPAGSIPGFRYSRALKSARIVWNAKTLDAFLADPQANIPGNAMPYPGMPDADSRAALIAFLATLVR